MVLATLASINVPSMLVLGFATSCSVCHVPSPDSHITNFTSLLKCHLHNEADFELPSLKIQHPQPLQSRIFFF